MFKAITVENFLTKEETSSILDFAKTIKEWESGGSDFWDDRSLNAITIYNNVDKEIGLLLYNIREKVGKQIQESFHPDRKVYPDLFQIVRWFPGQEQHPHADDMTNGDEEAAKMFQHRHYGSIIYLNNDYEGGETYYPNYNVSITPQPGMLAVHPGDPDHLHGVTEIKNNIRYTLASFWSLDSQKYDGWTIDGHDSIFLSSQ
jgi:hypothetical protein